MGGHVGTACDDRTWRVDAPEAHARNAFVTSLRRRALCWSLTTVRAWLLDAVRSGGLCRRDASLIYTTRVLGYTPAEVAAAQRRHTRTVRTQ